MAKYKVLKDWGDFKAGEDVDLELPAAGWTSEQLAELVADGTLELMHEAEVAPAKFEPVFALEVKWKETQPADEAFAAEQKAEAESFVKQTFEALKNMKEIPAAIESISIIRS